MAQFVVRHLEDDVKEGSRRRAKRHGRSMEDEVRHILRNAAKEERRACTEARIAHGREVLRRRVVSGPPGIARPAGAAGRLRLVIILDTNVLSALMRIAPDPSVVAWLDRQPAESVWITSITVCEARLGLALLPQGRRRRVLEAAFTRLLEDDLENRVLDFDAAAAGVAATLAAEREKAGRVADMRDTQLAGIAIARRATVATRQLTGTSPT